MNLKDFNMAYHYKYDPKNYDQWIVPKAEDGKILDDCDGYSLGVLYYVCCEGSFLKFWLSLITRKSKMCYVKTRTGGGHVVLRWEGKYIDNWTKRFVSKEVMEGLGHSFQFIQFTPLQVALKMAYTQYQLLKKDTLL